MGTKSYGSSSDWQCYKNGNAVVCINTVTGEKLRKVFGNVYRPQFAESIDAVVSKRCSNGCDWCYLGCSPQGKVIDFNDKGTIISLHPYTELAVNINSEIPRGFEEWLEAYKAQHVIVNTTVSMRTWVHNAEYIDSLVKSGLLHGVGISYDVEAWEAVRVSKSLLKLYRQDSNVLHIIAGLFNETDTDILDYTDRLLVLGYKNSGRGSDYNSVNIDQIQSNTHLLMSNLKAMAGRVKYISFDNIAIEQLNIENLVSADTWNLHYMGDEGTSTFAVDLVDGLYARSSHEPEESWKEISGLTPDQMFSYLQDTKEV